MHNPLFFHQIKSSNQSIRSIIEIGTVFLINHNIKNAKNEICWYLQKLYKCDSAGLFSIIDNTISDNFIDKFVNFVISRSKSIPFQYLLGSAPFYGRNYIVNSNVLIPRPESELIINIIQDKENCKMLDIGTGSGCLGITARLEKIAKEVDAIDISQEALSLAQHNSQHFNVKKINYIKMDILRDIPNKQYDIVISNPPYIAKNEYDKLDKEVKEYEPLEALTDMDNGYTFYNRYSNILAKLLKPAGIAVFEISHFFSKKIIKSIFKDFARVEFYNDLNNDLRAVKISND